MDTIFIISHLHIETYLDILYASPGTFVLCAGDNISYDFYLKSLMRIVNAVNNNKYK
jgi:hypothetical protein